MGHAGLSCGKFYRNDTSLWLNIVVCDGIRKNLKFYGRAEHGALWLGTLRRSNGCNSSSARWMILRLMFKL